MFLKFILFTCGAVLLVSDEIYCQESPVPERQFVANSSLANEKSETTTYRYPTATWSAESHAKKKASSAQEMWKLYLFKPSPFLKPPFTDGEAGAAITRIEDGLNVNGHRRGKVRWKSDEALKNKTNRPHEAVLDKFLRESLKKYIKSANLTDEFGTITLEMFAEALNKVTSTKKPAYDENKELHRKFKEENLTAKKLEAKTEASLIEKQYQKRLQKTWEVVNENISVPSRGAVLEPKENISWVVVELTTTLPEQNPTEIPIIEATSITEVPRTTNEPSTEPSTSLPKTSRRKKVPSVRGRGKKKYRDTLPKPSPEDTNELTFSVAESVYYGSRQNDLTETTTKESEYGAIPGVPHIDYPTLSQPLSTGFRCPKLAKGQSKMVADPQARCQVFYMCNGDGPATPMLCPNGTLFNELVHVCDWWFNVDCQN